MTKNAYNIIIGSSTGIFIGLIFAFLGTQAGVSSKSAILTAAAVTIIVSTVLTTIFWLLVPDDTNNDDKKKDNPLPAKFL